jgi:aspartyl-tRNA(Asn)/glutamyl-tRNA(Gln) amidotransferase subunit C
MGAEHISMQADSGGGTAKRVDEATVRRIARLARIKITDAEAASLQGELNGILQWVEQLNEVETAGVEPMTRVVPVAMKQRADAITDGDKAADIVANAPLREDGFFVVPKVVE